jgi:hypothetical protein
LAGQFLVRHRDRRAEGHDARHGVLQSRTTPLAKSQGRRRSPTDDIAIETCSSP